MELFEWGEVDFFNNFEVASDFFLTHKYKTNKQHYGPLTMSILNPKSWRYGSDDVPFKGRVIVFSVPAVHFQGV